MSMISEQIKMLEAVKDEIGRHHDEGWAWTAQVIDEAISTIQDLSEKLAAANMEQEKNNPLTLDELREMANKCEGIYVAKPDGSSVFRGQRYCAAVLDYSLPFGEMETHIHAIYGDRLTFWEEDYGKTWLAYRRKPNDR